MPRRGGPVVYMETLSVEERLLEPDKCQTHWYRFLAPWACRRSVLEIGAGTGYGIDILREIGANVHGIDLLPLRTDITDIPIESIDTKSYDMAIACDVIEHVEDDVSFFSHMLRVAREYVFISTPNWNISKAQNLYHVREYTPEELNLLLDAAYACRATETSKESHIILAMRTIFSSDKNNTIRAVKTFNDVENSFGLLIEVG